MSYLCVHGYIYSRCDVCTEIDRAVEEYLKEPVEVPDNEWMYDLYLEMDEKMIRESEDN